MPQARSSRRTPAAVAPLRGKRRPDAHVQAWSLADTPDASGRAGHRPQGQSALFDEPVGGVAITARQGCLRSGSDGRPGVAALLAALLLFALPARSLGSGASQITTLV